MKKTRYIPYGYTIKNGITVVETEEAEIIRKIFDDYLQGSSLKEIADKLTALKIPYTEKTAAWDKARIARIIDNARYIGDEEYELIINEEIYKRAAQIKSARRIRALKEESRSISELKKYMKCAKCGSTMKRHTNNGCVIRESWSCSNPECDTDIRIGDEQLLGIIKILLDRIIENDRLLIPKQTDEKRRSPKLTELNNDISRELEQDNPNEDIIIEKTIKIAQELYKSGANRAAIITALAKKRVQMMSGQKALDIGLLSDIIEYINIDSKGRLTLHTKTGTEVET